MTLFYENTRISKRRNRSGRLLWCTRTFFVRGGPKILAKNQKHVAPRRFWFSQTVCNLLFWGGAEYNRFNMGTSRTSQKCVCAKSRRRSHHVVGVFISVFSSAMSGKIAETAFRVHAIGHLVETKSWGPKVVLCLGEMALAGLVLALFCRDTRISERRNRSGRLLWRARTFFVRVG